MYIGLITDCLGDWSLEKVLEKCQQLGIQGVELGCGNWSSAPHVQLNKLLEDKNEQEKLKELLLRYDVKISALNASGNQLAPREMGIENDNVVKKTFELANELEIDKVVMMSGLPGGSIVDTMPNWVITSWPPETLTMLKYQWEKVAIPYWQGCSRRATELGINKIAIEPHGFQLVYNVETIRRLRKEAGDNIGFNMDPSHLFWMGADPIAVIRDLKDIIYHVHIKDIRREQPSGINTMLDGKHVFEFAERSWNFTIPGYGHDIKWWNDFIVNLHMIGYDDVLSIELEDYTMAPITALEKTVNTLESVML